MYSRHWSFLSIIAVMTLVVTIIAGCAPTAQSTKPSAAQAEVGVVKLGIVGPMKFLSGDHQWKGAALAVEEINAAGGFTVGTKKYTFDADKVDDNEFVSTPDAAAATEKAITVDKVNFIIGGGRTESVLAEQEVAMDHKTIYFGISQANPPNLKILKDYDRYKYYFNMPNCITTPNYSRLLVTLVAPSIEATKKALGTDKLNVALLMEKAVWADDIAGRVKSVLPKMNCTVVGEWRPAPLTTDVSSELTAIKNANAQFIVDVFSADGGIAVSRQWGETKVPAVMAGTNSIAMKDTHWTTTNGNCNYEAYFDWTYPVAMTDLTVPFYDAFTKKYNERATWSATGAYDNVYLLKAALEKAGTLDADKVVPVLEGIAVKGVTAPNVAFNEKTHPESPHAIKFGPGYTTGLAIQWLDGKQRPFWPDGKEISPALIDMGVPAGWDKVNYQGMSQFQVAPWVVDYWKGKL
ncbi:MAG: ABC transporter substrate-binding protein [Dehalococcoidia bacterium]|jgi:branched-chain amino acid transport system substrate-binding protein